MPGPSPTTSGPSWAATRRAAVWDVVNEAVADGGGLRDTCFLRAGGDDYVAEAFRMAHEADPDARLYYNDYGAEGLGRKSNAVFALVRRLVARGVPVHGVGLQMRLRADPPPTPGAVGANVRRLRALGLGVGIWEMDVRVRAVIRPDRRLALQRRVYRDAIGACAADAGIHGRDVLGGRRRALVGRRRVRPGRAAPVRRDSPRSPPTSACSRGSAARSERHVPVETERPPGERVGPEVGAHQADPRHLPEPG